MTDLKISAALDLLHEYCKRPGGAHTISDFIDYLNERQKSIPDGGDRPTTDSGQYVRAAMALKTAGADLETTSFLFNNFDLSLNFLHRLSVLRAQDIDENILFGFVANVYL